MSKIVKYKHISKFLQADPQDVMDKTYPSFMEHMLGKLDEKIALDMRCLVITLTKRSSEEMTNFLLAKGYKVFYLHSEVDTIDRREIIKKLKTGEIDIIVGVNLLREGIDLPEVGFMAILDADKQGFLRSSTALIQNIGRAARNPDSEVALYADKITKAMLQSLYETYRRRKIQMEHNIKNNITPVRAESNVKDLESVKTDEELAQHKQYQMIRAGKVKKIKRMTKKEKAMIAGELRKNLEEAITARKFEDAAVIRDQLKELEEG